MNRQHRSLAGLAAIALLIGLATVACARGGAAAGQPGATAGSTATAALAAEPTAADASAYGATPTDAVPVPTNSPSGSATVAGSAGGGGAAATTADPIGTDLQKLNQLIQGVQDSLSGAGGGGE